MNISGSTFLITGGNGMLAADVARVLTARGAASVATPDRDVLDITDPAAVAAALPGVDAVINCAAFTAVDNAEADEAGAFTVNAVGPATLARACREAGARLVHPSTDYVFAGDATAPYAESDPIAPKSAYGRTKAAGEWAVTAEDPDALIVRTAWLYGAGGPCFPKTIAKAGAERGALQVVADQVGQPTWTLDLAEFIVRLLVADAPGGIYHGTSSGQASWFEFAQAITRSAGLGDIVTPTDSAGYQRAAARPAWSVLGHDAAAGIGVESIGDWRERWESAAAEVLR